MRERNEFFIPTEYEIRGMELGSSAPDFAGRMKEIVEITSKEQDVNGKWFICYYVPFGKDGGKISHSLKEGELDRSLSLSKKYTRHELDQIEASMLDEVENRPF